jgi:hypothetical protein
MDTAEWKELDEFLFARPDLADAACWCPMFQREQLANLECG